MVATTSATLPVDTATCAETRPMRFEALVESYSPDLYRIAYWLCRDRDMAEDLVQETFLRAWRAVESMRDERAAKAWLLTILRREHARRFERQQPKFEDVDPHSLVAWDNEDKRTEALVLRRAIASLPFEYREPLILQVLGGYSTAEIGDLLNLSRAEWRTPLRDSDNQPKRA